MLYVWKCVVVGEAGSQLRGRLSSDRTQELNGG